MLKVLPPPEEELGLLSDPEAEMRRLEEELRFLQEEEDRIRMEEEKMSSRVGKINYLADGTKTRCS
jgi:hypothetical protein